MLKPKLAPFHTMAAVQQLG